MGADSAQQGSIPNEGIVKHCSDPTGPDVPPGTEIDRRCRNDRFQSLFSLRQGWTASLARSRTAHFPKFRSVRSEEIDLSNRFSSSQTRVKTFPKGNFVDDPTASINNLKSIAIFRFFRSA
jgi:hypothetical protein